MRRFILFLCLAALAALAAPAAAAGTDTGEKLSSGAYTYELHSDGTAALTGCTASDAYLTLPAKVDGHTVTALLSGLFPYDCPAVTIVIPAGVRHIDPLVFSDCAVLENILTADGNTAYRSIDGLLYAAGSSALTACPPGRQGEIELPDGINAVAPYAFAQCGQLTDITVPEGVTEIGEGAFYCCFDLSVLRLPKSLARFESPASVFNGCFSLTDVYYEGTQAEWDLIEGNNALPEDTTLHTKTGAAIRASGEWSGLNWTLDEDGVLTISGNGGMDDFTSLSTAAWLAYQQDIVRAEILENVTGIGAYAFTGCVSLQEVSLPQSAVRIGDYAFDGCESLRQVTIPSGVAQIGTGAFYGCGRLTQLTVPADHPVFASSDGVLLSRDMTKVLCCPCGKTGVVTLPDSVTEICESAFYGCAKLSGVTLPRNTAVIGAYAFFGCGGLTGITFPDGLLSIGGNAFNGCGKLKSVVLPASVSEIGTYAFCSCSSLESAVLPASLTAVRAYTFCDCAKLESVSVPEGVERIDAGAFIYCGALRTVFLPSTLTQVGGNAFRACTALSDVWYAGTESGWAGITVLSGNDPLRLAALHCVRIDIALPYGTAEIGSEAFAGIADGLTVRIPGSVTVIAADAFSGVRELTIIGVPGSRAETFAAQAGYTFVPMSD